MPKHDDAKLTGRRKEKDHESPKFWMDQALCAEIQAAPAARRDDPRDHNSAPAARCSDCGSRPERSPSSVERWRGQERDSDIRPYDDRTLEQELRAAGRAHRNLRSGWHSMGFSSDVHAGDLLPR